MSAKNKNHNRIIFLTTLSVYLGLVLVGATPAALSQAAMTRQFDIKSEIEYKDDLDNKPDDEKIASLVKALDVYFGDAEEFVRDLQKLHSIEKFNLDFDKFELNELGFVPCNVDGDPVRRSGSSERIDNYWLKPAITNARYNFENWNFLSDCLKDEKFDAGVSTGSGLKLFYDKAELIIEVSAFKSSPQKATQLAGNFAQAYKIYAVDNDEPIVKKLYDNTSFKSENNQVFIVTRLPRAAIDEFLATRTQ